MIASSTTYWPFGLPLEADNPQTYRFGFNGMEKDPEITGEQGSHYTAAFWEYDTRIGRRWNVDPVTYPWQSSYAVFNNNPIIFTDPLGLFGTRKEARQFRRHNNDVRGRIKKDYDGRFSIYDKNNKLQYTRPITGEKPSFYDKLGTHLGGGVVKMATADAGLSYFDRLDEKYINEQTREFKKEQRLNNYQFSSSGLDQNQSEIGHYSKQGYSDNEINRINNKAEWEIAKSQHINTLRDVSPVTAGSDQIGLGTTVCLYEGIKEVPSIIFPELAFSRLKLLQGPAMMSKSQYQYIMRGAYSGKGIGVGYSTTNQLNNGYGLYKASTAYNIQIYNNYQNKIRSGISYYGILKSTHDATTE